MVVFNLIFLFLVISIVLIDSGQYLVHGMAVRFFFNHHSEQRHPVDIWHLVGFYQCMLDHTQVYHEQGNVL